MYACAWCICGCMRMCSACANACMICMCGCSMYVSACKDMSCVYMVYSYMCVVGTCLCNVYVGVYTTGVCVCLWWEYTCAWCMCYMYGWVNRWVLGTYAHVWWVYIYGGVWCVLGWMVGVFVKYIRYETWHNYYCFLVTPKSHLSHPQRLLSLQIRADTWERQGSFHDCCSILPVWINEGFQSPVLSVRHHSTHPSVPEEEAQSWGGSLWL